MQKPANGSPPNAVLLGMGSWRAPLRVSTAVVQALGGQLWAPSAPVSRHLTTHSARMHLIRCYSSVDTHAHPHSFSFLLRGEVHLPSVVYGSESMPLHPSCATSPSIPGVLENSTLTHTHMHTHALHRQHSTLTLTLSLSLSYSDLTDIRWVVSKSKNFTR